MTGLQACHQNIQATNLGIILTQGVSMMKRFPYLPAPGSRKIKFISQFYFDIKIIDLSENWQFVRGIHFGHYQSG